MSADVHCHERAPRAQSRAVCNLNLMASLQLDPAAQQLFNFLLFFFVHAMWKT